MKLTWERVADPGFELVLPQDDKTKAVLERSPWLRPWSVTADLELRIGSSATVIRTPEATVLVDPFLAFDDPAAHDRRMGALDAAGVPALSVDIVIDTHVDGVGVNLVPGTGEAAFPNARYLVPAAALEELKSGRHAGAEGLLGIAEPITAPAPVVDGIALIDLPGHAGGHLGVAIGEPVEAVVCGHLFIHPAQVPNPDTPGLDDDTPTATATRRALLARCADEGIALIGPLWADPGSARVVRDGEGFALAIADDDQF